MFKKVLFALCYFFSLSAQAQTASDLLGTRLEAPVVGNKTGDSVYAPSNNTDLRVKGGEVVQMPIAAPVANSRGGTANGGVLNVTPQATSGVGGTAVYNPVDASTHNQKVINASFNYAFSLVATLPPVSTDGGTVVCLAPDTEIDERARPIAVSGRLGGFSVVEGKTDSGAPGFISQKVRRSMNYERLIIQIPAAGRMHQFELLHGYWYSIKTHGVSSFVSGSLIGSVSTSSGSVSGGSTSANGLTDVITTHTFMGKDCFANDTAYGLWLGEIARLSGRRLPVSKKATK